VFYPLLLSIFARQLQFMLKQELSNRFGDHRVLDFPIETDSSFHLIQLNLELKRMPVTVIMTDGLRRKSMDVPKAGMAQHIELFFCFPSYWELEEKDNPNMQWPIDWLKKLGKHLMGQPTWFGVGHTFSNGNPPKAFSTTMQPNHLILTEPIELEEHLREFHEDGKLVHFLAVVPIFEQEFDIKNAKGYSKFIRKFRSKNGNEILDDFRQNIYASKWRIF
jgi:hypothetical protein